MLDAVLQMIIISWESRMKLPGNLVSDDVTRRGSIWGVDGVVDRKGNDTSDVSGKYSMRGDGQARASVVKLARQEPPRYAVTRMVGGRLSGGSHL